jgi:hypothetical protein
MKGFVISGLLEVSIGSFKINKDWDFDPKKKLYN